MTEQEQRIAIAEACGWKMFCQEAIDGNWRTKERWITAPDGTSQFRHNIPDYLHDLNASVEFEQVIVHRDLWRQYVEHLRKITGHQDPIDASAAARLQAALCTLNLWKD